MIWNPGEDTQSDPVALRSKLYSYEIECGSHSSSAAADKDHDKYLIRSHDLRRRSCCTASSISSKSICRDRMGVHQIRDEEVGSGSDGNSRTSDISTDCESLSLVQYSQDHSGVLGEGCDDGMVYDSGEEHLAERDEVSDTSNLNCGWTSALARLPRVHTVSDRWGISEADAAELISLVDAAQTLNL